MQVVSIAAKTQRSVGDWVDDVTVDAVIHVRKCYFRGHELLNVVTRRELPSPIQQLETPRVHRGPTDSYSPTQTPLNSAAKLGVAAHR